MNKTEIRERMTLLINKLLQDRLSQKEDAEIFDELNSISPNPYWSDLIFWTDDYVGINGEIKYDEYFKEIFNGSGLSTKQKRNKAIDILKRIINNDYSDPIISTDIFAIVELNRLHPNKDWWDLLYPNQDRNCLNPEFLDKEGNFNYDLFVEKIFNTN